MQIDPKVQQYFHIAMLIVSIIAGMTVSQFPSYFPNDYVNAVIQTASFITVVYSGVNVILAGVSSTNPGPWAPQDPPLVKAAQSLADVPPFASPQDFEVAKVKLKIAANI